MGTWTSALGVPARVMTTAPSGFCSRSALRGCVARARDMTAGGADYNFASISGRGFGTAVNSLAALRWAVYDTGQVSLERLLAALEAKGLEPAQIHAVLFTHLHPDHIGHKDLFRHALFEQACARYPRREVARDDIIDAMVCAVTAKQGDGHYQAVPAAPARDGQGLAMEIVYPRSATMLR